jgi:hypothetical protein
VNPGVAAADLFLPVPVQMLGNVLSPQEAVDWLAFGPPSGNVRLGMSLDEQLESSYPAARLLLLALWGGELPAYVHSPVTDAWYRIPPIYWERPSIADVGWTLDAANVPEVLPGHAKPLDPRYEISVHHYPYQMPADDLVGQLILFRSVEVERYCSVAKPMFAQKTQQTSPLPGSKRPRSGQVGRPNKVSRALAIFKERLSQGVTSREKAAESRAIVEAWKGAGPPVPATIAEALKPYYDASKWEGGRLTNVAELMAMLADKS